MSCRAKKGMSYGHKHKLWKQVLSDCLHVKGIKIKQRMSGLTKRSQNLVRRRVLILKKFQHMRKNYGGVISLL